MELIVFQLHPDWLENPDADLRYLIPEELEKLSNDKLKIAEDGYEYDDEDDYMYIFFKVTSSDTFLAAIKKYLTENRILNNNILNSCIIAKMDIENYKILYKFNTEAKFKKPPEITKNI